MKAKIRIIALVCSVMLAFMLIAGCGGNNADGNGGDNGGGNQSAVVAPPAPEHLGARTIHARAVLQAVRNGGQKR